MKTLFAVGILLTLALVLVIVNGCSSLPMPSPANIVADAELAIQTAVPYAVEYACSQDANAVPYLTAAANVLDAAVLSTNYSPAQLIAALDASSAAELKTPLAQAAIMAGIGIYQSYLSGNVVNNADAKAIITALATAIRQGLPPNQPSAHRSYGRGGHLRPNL